MIKTDDAHYADFQLGRVLVRRTTAASAIAYLANVIESAGDCPPPTLVAFCNAHTATLAYQNQKYQLALSDMLVLNDGIGMEIAAKLTTGVGFPENLNGTDFVPRLLTSITKPLRIYLLGASQEVIKDAAQELAKQYTPHCVVGFHHGYFAPEEETSVIAKIRDSQADIVLVGMGNPHQELLMAEYASSFNCRLVIGVGALFDFISGHKPRAPEWIRRLRFEWLFRLGLEPRRLARRYTVELLIFFWAVFHLRMSFNGSK